MDKAQAGRAYRRCVEATREFVTGAGFTDVVIGLSGGMDSALIAVMAVDALGAEHVHGVLLPGPYSSDHSYDDAQELASNLGISTDVISICEPFEAFEATLRRACGGELAGLAAENTQARCRMICLMALSNTYGWLMLNTGNRSEAMMGYSTLYGDTAGAFAPIGGLYKTEVYKVARWRNNNPAPFKAAAGENGVPESEGMANPSDSGRIGIRFPDAGPIPERVFEKPPSAELSPGQRDETSLGIDYPTLDGILGLLNEGGRTRDEIVDAGYAPEQVDRVLGTVRATAFKRAMEPPFAEVERS